MTFLEWRTAHTKAMNTILSNLPPEVDPVVYFQHSNMIVAQPDYCPLYPGKCHDTQDTTFNCYFCACPFFIASDNIPLYTLRGSDHFSSCSIGSKFADVFTTDNSSQCDCTYCLVPHRTSFVYQYLRKHHATH
jgi:hypothetical protein